MTVGQFKWRIRKLRIDWLSIIVWFGIVWYLALFWYFLVRIIL